MQPLLYRCTIRVAASRFIGTWKLASLTIPSWNRIASFLESRRQLRDPPDSCRAVTEWFGVRKADGDRAERE